MYRASAILESWRGLIGWRQNYDPNGKQLEDEMVESASNMFYQDEHPMLTLQNLESIMPDYSLVNYPAWDIATNYKADEVVKNAGVNYKAKRDNVGLIPGDNLEDDWKVFNPFSEWLKQKTDAGIIDTIIQFLEKKELNKTAKTIIERKSLFDGIGKIDDTIPNKDRRAGFEIVASRSMGLTVRLDRIGLQRTTAGDVTIQLHHSSKETPLKTLILSFTKPNSIHWFDLGWDLPYISDDTDGGGAYYVTYKQTGTSGLAIKKEKEWNEAPCEGCVSKTELNTWKAYSSFVEFHPFTVPEIDGENLWDIDDNRYEYSSNQGLNFQISLYCDYTDFFTEQRDLFKSVLRKRVAINLLRELAYNTNSRINQSESTVTRQQLLYEIDGDTRGRKTGINHDYIQSMDAISLNTEGLNRLCLPCKSNGVRYRTV